MWTFTTYILMKYLEKCAPKDLEFTFAEFASFIFDILWRRNKMVFHDGKEDLYLDFKYLKKIEVLEFEESETLEKVKMKVKNKEKLDQIAKTVENSATITGVDLLNEYVERINSAIECV